MADYIETDDVRAAAYGLDIPDGAEVEESLQRLIDKAERRLVAKVPSLPGRVDSGALGEPLVRDALEDIVLRVVRNPSGFSSEQAGEFSYRIDRATASGRIEIRPEDLAGLLPPRRKMVGSVRLAVPPWRLP